MPPTIRIIEPNITKEESDNRRAAAEKYISRLLMEHTRTTYEKA